jgi:hypothetical protein
MRKVCELTDKGRQAYRAAAEVWSAVVPALQDAVEQGMEIRAAVPAGGDR